MNAVTPEFCVVGEDLGPDAATVIGALSARLHAAGRVDQADPLTEAVLAREAIGTTALPGGIAMPHARHESVTTPSVVAALLPEAVTWTDGSGPVRLVLLVAAPDSNGYLALVQKVAAACVKKAFVDDVNSAGSADELAEILAGATHQR
jgi:fructose PTS system EIIA component